MESWNSIRLCSLIHPWKLNATDSPQHHLWYQKTVTIHRLPLLPSINPLGGITKLYQSPLADPSHPETGKPPTMKTIKFKTKTQAIQPPHKLTVRNMGNFNLFLLMFSCPFFTIEQCYYLSFLIFPTFQAMTSHVANVIHTHIHAHHDTRTM